ncbi:hypothetical protein BBBOND_0403820 [Babesia bigemina]|uniref:Uncharacterized protein n=1 Tax=Babesia bigemina TaxID=5866 RepID=A0A061DE22_BABBI|nr:hypothetical protein BBBOND_0403820 [Babesia bigemina]CDR97894.1 hypothetical protein BBBOND_0403820 [Babesia bigemina]|eukprot:XP_012770080.1 hypothetical protein BBBOND_0403820 [Babesia bigemina]
MVFNSLTEAPHNLKEGIDWLIAVKGTDAGKNIAALGDAVHKLLADKPVGYTDVPALEKVKRISKEFLEQPELVEKWPANNVLVKFNKPIDRKPQFFQKLFRSVDKCDYTNVVKETPLSASTITQKLGKAVNGFEKFLGKITSAEQYESAYSSEATWEKSCSEKPEDCAAVFVGIAPMLWAGIRTLDDASYPGDFSWLGLGNKKNVSAKLLSALGFKDAGCLSNTTAPNVSSAVAIVKNNGLQTFHDLSGFWAFYDCTKVPSVDAEPSVDGEGEQSMIPEAEPSFEGEGEQSMIPEAEPSFEGEGEQSMIPEAEPTVDGEGEQSMIPEAEPTVDGEGEQSLIPEAEPTVDGEGEQSLIPEAEPSAEPVKPEVDEVEQPVKVAKAAKVARSVKAAKKAAKKVSKKARQRKQKKQKKQQESAEQ